MQKIINKEILKDVLKQYGMGDQVLFQLRHKNMVHIDLSPDYQWLEDGSLNKKYVEDCIKKALEVFEFVEFSNNILVVYENIHEQYGTKERNLVESTLMEIQQYDMDELKWKYADDDEVYNCKRHIYYVKEVNKIKLFRKIILSDLGGGIDLCSAVSIIDIDSGYIFRIYDDRGLCVFSPKEEDITKVWKRFNNDTMEKSMYMLYKFGLEIKTLEFLSYKSKLGISFKRSLGRFSKEDVVEEIKEMRMWYNQQKIIDTLPIDSRIKSIGSAAIKFDKYYPDINYSSVFNDILGFRAICSDYEEVLALGLEEKIRIVDMSTGKSNDDGYRGVHVYYQKDNHHYPIEIQLNTYYDRQFNDWMHDKFYKRGFNDKIGQQLRKDYESGKIKSRKEFEEVLIHVLSNCKKV